MFSYTIWLFLNILKGKEMSIIWKTTTHFEKVKASVIIFTIFFVYVFLLFKSINNSVHENVSFLNWGFYEELKAIFSNIAWIFLKYIKWFANFYLFSIKKNIYLDMWKTMVVTVLNHCNFSIYLFSLLLWQRVSCFRMIIKNLIRR